MKIELTQEQTFSARAGDQLVHGLRITSEWEGLRKLVDGTGRHMIVDGEGIVLKGTPALLRDLHLTVLTDGFITVPAATLPTGYTVPSFQVAQYHASMADDGTVTVDGSGKPMVNISYHAARDACTDHGYKLITELQCLAIAHNIAQQDINWSGGKVGAGSIYQGIRRGNVNGPQAASYEPGEDERRWHELSNGVRIYDFAGNVWSWVFDDVQGDIDGLVKGSIAKDSPSLSCAPAPSCEKGVGWVPTGPVNWSGHALVRGGCWYSRSRAGVFYLGYGSPGYDRDSVGFRCTK